MKLTDYRYRKLRNEVKAANIRPQVKNLLYCTLRDYKKENSIPNRGMFENGSRRCIIGAALWDKSLRDELDYPDELDEGDWIALAKKAFDVRSKECDTIICNFDNPGANKKSPLGRLVSSLSKQLCDSEGYDF